MKYFYSVIFSLLTASVLFGQATSTPGITVGLLYADQSQTSAGYLLFSPQGSTKVYLIDNCGELVNDWTMNGSSNYSGCYLLEDGSVIKFITSGNNGYSAAYGNGCFERRDWDNNLMWSYCGSGRYAGLHSDMRVLDNGNVLAVCQDLHSITEAANLGLNISGIWGNDYKTESIIEFQPTGMNSANVVWEWHTWDHLIQDDNPGTPTYGIIADNPGRYDADLIAASGNMHVNGMDYNADLDHIIFSSWKDSEVFIIDHGITTTEAAGPQGEFLYRWGNPQNYDRGNNGDQRLGGQHNPHWIPSSYAAHGGKMSVFNNRYGENNGLGSNISGSCIFEPIWDAASQTYMMDAPNGTYLPANFSHVWWGNAIDNSTAYSSIMGGVDVQKNGNIIMCEATRGRFSESTPAGDVVWVYQNPNESGNVEQQGDSSNNADVYKLDKYAPDYAGLAGRDLTPYGTIENNNSISANCEVIVDECNLVVTMDDLPSTTSSATPLSLSGTPAGGTFDGPGVVFNAFNPGIAGPGFHTITYTYDDGNGCVESDTENIIVVNISYSFVTYNLGTISPGKAGTVDIQLDALQAGVYQLQVVDIQGRQIISQFVDVSPGQQRIRLQHEDLQSGNYIVNMSSATENVSKKLILY